MGNPILTLLNKNKDRASELPQWLKAAKGNPEPIFNQMMKTNPQFRQFVNQNGSKTPEEIAMAYGLNPNLVKQLMK